MKERHTQKLAQKSNSSKPKQVKSAEELKISLIQSLNSCMTKLGLPSDIISENNIIDFNEQIENGKNVYKCGFSCLFCSKVVPMQHKIFWMTSNATRHIKYHYEKGSTVLATVTMEDVSLTH